MPLIKNIINILQPFAIGGFSGCFATICIQPFDMIKVRIQLKSERYGMERGNKVSPFRIMKEVYRQAGFRGFYIGLGPALVRQFLFATTRQGTYKTLYYKYQANNHDEHPSFSLKSLFAMTGGAIAAFFITPPELALIRMQADATLKSRQRRNYNGLFNAMITIARNEGVMKLWTGLQAVLLRGLVGMIAMQAAYDEIKSHFSIPDSKQSILISSALAGLCQSAAIAPFDNCKTKLQKQVQNSKGKFRYKNVFDVFYKTAKWEGVSGLWVGFPIFYLRTGPHAMITLIVQDVVTMMISKYRKKLKNE